MTPEQKRQTICELASSQEGVVGAERYWREVLGPKWQGPYPRHWCGAFALWCLREAIGCNWEWKVGLGFLFRLLPTDNPLPGDICYIDKPYQHHAVLLAIGEQDNGKRFTISQDGNQGAAPGKCLRIYRKLPKWSAIYSIESLL